MSLSFQPRMPANGKDQQRCRNASKTEQTKTERLASEDECSGRLPEAHASEIIELEIECEARDVPIETIKKLLALYAQAIDYFVARQSDKCYYFKKKMAALMIQPQVIEAMEAAHERRVLAEVQRKKEQVGLDNPSSSLLKNSPEQKKLSESGKQWVTAQMKRQEFEVTRRLSGLGQASKVQELVLAHGFTTARNNVLVQGNLKQQLEALGNKLQLRKAAKTASTISGFTKEVLREAAEVSVRSDSREKTPQCQPGVAENDLLCVRRRCGSHRVLSTAGGNGENLFGE